jgi:hypothetical protein
MRFEAVDIVPRNSAIPMVFVQCESCGGVVSALDAKHIGRYLEGIVTALKGLGARFELPPL